MIFLKYQALGNDYLFLDAQQFPMPSKSVIQKVCDRHFGIGSDGILYGSGQEDHLEVTIINPDGTIAEVSGNGVRIFARAMFDTRKVFLKKPFNIRTSAGRLLRAEMLAPYKVKVDMGMPQFEGPQLPHRGDGEYIYNVGEEEVHYFPVSMGNPHCVVFEPSLDKTRVMKLGPKLENNPDFPEKTNVQFVHVESPRVISAEIWERGAGYTLASGSSACALFAAAHRRGMCHEQVEVRMPGGTLYLSLDANGHIWQEGEVHRIAECRYCPDDSQ